MLNLGCRYQLPAIKPPKINASAAGQAAIKQYDSDGDGFIAGEELETAPSLRFALDRIDTNDDEKIFVDEVTEFIQSKWLDAQAGAIRVKCIVTLNGRAVDGAIISFEPEAFLGDGIVKPATGVTRDGFATMSVAKEDQPHPNARGVMPGLYLVRISKVVDGNELIPARFNKDTTLGVEVAPRASYMPGAINFRLK